MADTPTYRRIHPIVPVMTREEVISLFCEALGLEQVQHWEDAEAISTHDPVTGSQFCAPLDDDLETTRDRLCEHRWRFDHRERWRKA